MSMKINVRRVSEILNGQEMRRVIGSCGNGPCYANPGSLNQPVCVPDGTFCITISATQGQCLNVGNATCECVASY